jgi:hypothetical protein
VAGGERNREDRPARYARKLGDQGQIRGSGKPSAS